jgi:hypothetical protein
MLLRRLTYRITVVGALVMTSAFHSILAQDEAARIGTQDIVNRNLPPVEPQPLPPEITDRELGDISVVLRVPPPKIFTLSTSQSLNFTTNAFLTQDNRQDAWFWNGRIDASFVPYATRDFTPRLTLEQNWFRYDHFSQLDFDAQSAQLDLKYDLTPDDRWFLDGSYAYSRLYSQHPSIGQFYKFGLLNLSVNYITSLSQVPISLALTGGTYWRQGEPSTFDRVSPYFGVIGIYNLPNSVQLTGFLRPELQFYLNDPTESDRKDLNLTIGTTLSWTPLPYVTLAATISYVGNYSTVGARGYNVFTPSAVVAASIAF